MKIIFIIWKLLAFNIFNIYIYIYIYIYNLILTCHQHGYPWPFLATSPNRSSLPACPLGYTPYLHRAAECGFELAALLLLGYVNGVPRSTSLRSSSLLLQQCPACLVHLTWIVFLILFTNLSDRAGYDTRSIFKRSLTGLNSEFSFS